MGRSLETEGHSHRVGLGRQRPNLGGRFIMRLHPEEPDFHSRFPNARVVGRFEGGLAYEAERDGTSYLILDESARVRWLSAHEPAQRWTGVLAIEFMSEASRASYVACHFKDGVAPGVDE